MSCQQSSPQSNVIDKLHQHHLSSFSINIINSVKYININPCDQNPGGDQLFYASCSGTKSDTGISHRRSSKFLVGNLQYCVDVMYLC